jgi:hypothetical protein
MFVSFVLFAFAKANSQSDPAMTVRTTISIDQNTTRTDLISLLNSLRTEQHMEVKSTSFRRSDDRIKKLGLNLTDVEDKISEFETDGSSGIKKLCILINPTGTIAFLGLCESLSTAFIENDKYIPANSPAVITGDQIVPEATISQNLTANGSRRQELGQLRRKSSSREQQRLAVIQIAKSEKAAEKIDILENKQNEISDDLQSMNDRQTAVRTELKALETENNRIKRERKTLDYNNKRALAKRDSLQQHQERLFEKIDLGTAQLEATIVAQQEANEVILRQNQVIEEQGLLAETAEGIKAYRTALLGNPENDELKKQGYLFFAADQCSYKVYESYTIVYDAMGKVMFSIDKELMDQTVSGELKIRGRAFDYFFKSNFLIVKNKLGKLVNEYGDLLDGSMEEIEEIPFVVTHNFTINNNTSPRELLAMKTDMGTMAMYMEVIRENRNDGGILTDLGFFLQGREYEFHEKSGIPQISVEIDQPNAQSRVKMIQE